MQRYAVRLPDELVVGDDKRIAEADLPIDGAYTVGVSEKLPDGRVSG
jgi:hypothetical protein